MQETKNTNIAQEEKTISSNPVKEKLVGFVANQANIKDCNKNATFIIETEAKKTIELTKEKIKEIIAKRIAKEFKDNDIITLGIGLPTEAANYVKENVNVIFQSENGVLGIGRSARGEEINPKIVNAGGACVTINKGASFYDSQMAFTIMRGGHIDATVLGALQVDEEGSIASWQIPGKFVPGIGGSMDLIVGSKKVIVAMTHTAKDDIKIMKRCTLPLTAYKEVDMIVTERCVFMVTNEGLLLTEINPMFTVEDIQNCTGADFKISNYLKEMEI